MTHVGGVPHNFVLDFLPSLQALFDEYLRAQTQTLGGEVPQLLFIVSEAGPESSERKGGTQNDWIADCLRSIQCRLNSGHGS